MEALEILRADHRVVDRLLDALGTITLDARVQGQLDGPAARACLTTLERFVDGVHQDREERGLFPKLLEQASQPEIDTLEWLVAGHAQERRRFLSLVMQLEGAVAGRSASLDRFIGSAVLYQRLQRNHLTIEERLLFPVAEALLTPADDRAILDVFRKIDLRFDRGGPRLFQAFTLLRERFGVPIPDGVAPSAPNLRGVPRSSEPDPSKIVPSLLPD